MQIKAMVEDLFPTRLWRFDLSGLESHFDGWVKTIEQWRAEQAEPRGRSNRMGWNSQPTVFTRPEFAPLKSVVSKAFGHAIQEMKPTATQKVVLEAWANVHDTGGFNVLHMHPNCVLSGCFYLHVPDGAGAISFRDPRPGVVMAGFAGTGANCQKPHKILPKAGELLLFPHWLEHLVEPNEAPTPRYSIAINALALPPSMKFEEGTGER